MEQLPLHGFSVNGYRSFHGEPQKIAPLGKMNLFAGANNSGKSNVLLAAQTWIPLCGRGSSAIELEKLDLPQMRNEAHTPPPLSIGIALPMTQDVLFDLLNQRSDSRRKRIEDIQRLAEFALGLPGLGEQNGTGHTLWVEWDWSGNSLGPSQLQPQRIAQSLDPYGENLISSYGNEHLSRSGSATTNIAGIIDILRSTLTTPEVISIPAIREVKHDGSLTHEQWEFSGLGLPRLIQSWLAPTAENHRAGRRKYERLNQFLRTVLEDQSADIGAPFNGDTIHISLRDLTLPLQNLGTGYAQVVLMAAIATEHDNKILCIEEPELHLHPTLLRKLLNYLLEQTNNQYLISTHSAHMIDNPSVTLFRTAHVPAEGTEVSLASTPTQRAEIAQLLGYRPSDLVQSNTVIWVEGPSDRIYLNHWIGATDSRLVEGVHYSILFYGGALVAHLTAEDVDESDLRGRQFVSLLRINRNMIMMIDSDRESADSPLKERAKRVTTEFAKSKGLAWITAGREVENYLPIEVFTAAAQKAHSRSTVETGPSVDPFEDLAKRVSTELNKVPVATAAIATAEGLVWDVLDLRERMAEVVTYIRVANGLVQDGAA